MFFVGSLWGNVYGMNQMYLMDFVFSFMVSILVFVSFWMVYLFGEVGSVKLMNLNFKMIEFWCGFLPILILFFQVLFSYGCLYYDNLVTESLEGRSLSVKVLGRQWFWSYEYEGLGDWMKFESYMLGFESLNMGDMRMLEVDNRLVLPCNSGVVLRISSCDVIHSWFLPSCGFKADAMPGYMNIHMINMDVVGVFYGMCAEICGAGHSYMPVVVEVVPSEVFFSWLEDYKHKFDIATRLGDWYSMNGLSSFV